MKEFHYQVCQDYDKVFAKKGNTYCYYSNNKASEMALNVSPLAIHGVIGKKFSSKIGALAFEQQEATLPVYSNTYSTLFYKVSGYIICEDEEYIAVIKLRKWLWIIPLLLIVISLLCFWLFTNDDGISRLDPNAKKYTPKIEYNQKKIPNQIQLPGYDRITMAADTKKLYAALWNPDDNPCFFQFTLSLDGKDIYTSGLIPPGEAITTIELKQFMTEGEYPLQIKIDTFDLKDDTKQLNGGVINAHLIVTNRKK